MCRLVCVRKVRFVISMVVGGSGCFVSKVCRWWCILCILVLFFVSRLVKCGRVCLGVVLIWVVKVCCMVVGEL